MGRKERASSDLSTASIRPALNGFAVSRTVVALSTDSAFLCFHQETCVWRPGREESVGMQYVHTERRVRNLNWHRLILVQVKTGRKKRALPFCKEALAIGGAHGRDRTVSAQVHETE